MLNISENTFHHAEDLSQLQSLKTSQLPGWHLSFRKLMLALLVIFLLFMFLPWTQTVRADGKVTTLRPEQRPQTIHATIAGRIDRLVVKPGRVLIVDYKSDARPPGSPDGVPAAYLSQMGLYALVAQQLFPGHSIATAILWTSLETLMDLPAAKLRETVASFTVG